MTRHAPLSPDKTIVIMPAYNEENTVGRVVTDIRSKTGLPVLVVNDKSNDSTLQNAIKAGAIGLDLCCQLGSWGATQAGIRFALKKGYRRCITCDADGQHDALAIQTLLSESVASDSDIIIGSCLARGSVARHLAWNYFKIITKLPLDDFTSGLRVYSHRAMQKVALSRSSMVDYQDLSVLLILKEFGMTFTEVQVSMADRECGKSRIFNSWLAVFNYMILSSIIALCRISR